MVNLVIRHRKMYPHWKYRTKEDDAKIDSIMFKELMEEIKNAEKEKKESI